jgi:hypothetical protein
MGFDSAPSGIVRNYFPARDSESSVVGLHKEEALFSGEKHKHEEMKR